MAHIMSMVSFAAIYGTVAVVQAEEDIVETVTRTYGRSNADDHSYHHSNRGCASTETKRTDGALQV